MCLFLTIIAPTYLTIKTIEYFFPEQTKKIIDTVKEKSVIGFNYLYTSSSHYVVSLYTKSKNYLFLNENSSAVLNHTIKFIDDGEEVAVYTIDDFLLNKSKGTININYDFILYEIPAKNDDDKYDKYIFRYEKMNDILCLEYSNQKGIDFSNIQLSINGSSNIYKIEFGKTQYMMDGNILFDRAFIKWVLKQTHSICLDKLDQYLITFMDHTMKFITLPEYCYLLINQKKYDIINVIDE